MTKNMPLQLTPSLTARMLASNLGESELTWTTRLANWRRKGRISPISCGETEAGYPVFNGDAVQTYIDENLAQRAAATPPNTGPGQARAGATAVYEGNARFVRVTWNAGQAQGVFSLSAATAKDLAAKLIQAADKTTGPMP